MKKENIIGLGFLGSAIYATFFLKTINTSSNPITKSKKSPSVFLIHKEKHFPLYAVYRTGDLTYFILSRIFIDEETMSSVLIVRDGSEDYHLAKDVKTSYLNDMDEISDPKLWQKYLPSGWTKSGKKTT